MNALEANMYSVFLSSVWAKASLTAQRNLVFLILKMLNAGCAFNPSLWIQGQLGQPASSRTAQGYRGKPRLENQTKTKQTAKRGGGWACYPAVLPSHKWEETMRQAWMVAWDSNTKTQKQERSDNKENGACFHHHTQWACFQSWELTKAFLKHARQALYHWGTAQCFRVPLT